MFSFIKGESLNDDDEDEKRGFQWFIDKYGPDDDNLCSRSICSGNTFMTGAKRISIAMYVQFLITITEL